MARVRRHDLEIISGIGAQGRRRVGGGRRGTDVGHVAGGDAFEDLVESDWQTVGWEGLLPGQNDRRGGGRPGYAAGRVGQRKGSGRGHVRHGRVNPLFHGHDAVVISRSGGQKQVSVSSLGGRPDGDLLEICRRGSAKNEVLGQPCGVGWRRPAQVDFLGRNRRGYQIRCGVRRGSVGQQTQRWRKRRTVVGKIEGLNLIVIVRITCQ